MPALTVPRDEEFAQIYARTRNSKKAAYEAGFPQGVLASSILARPVVARRIQELLGEAMAANGVTAERVIGELGRVAFQSVHDLYDHEGNLISPHALPDDAAATISGIDVETRFEDTGEDAVPVRTLKIRRVDKMAALGLLAKHFKIVGEDSDGVNALASALADRLKTARQRAYDPNYKPDDNPTDVEDARIIPPRQVVDSMNPPQPAPQPAQEAEDEPLW